MIKTSEFIKLLQKEDPNDECYVCVSNHPVSWIEKLPYYYDGRMEWIEKDDHGTPIKVGYPTDKQKLKIHYDTIEDALLENPEAELILDAIKYKGEVQERYMECIREWQKEGRKYQDWNKTAKVAHSVGETLSPFAEPTFRYRLRVWFKSLWSKK